jgi:hypothetical protein
MADNNGKETAGENGAGETTDQPINGVCVRNIRAYEDDKEAAAEDVFEASRDSDMDAS